MYTEVFSFQGVGIEGFQVSSFQEVGTLYKVLKRGGGVNFPFAPLGFASGDCNFTTTPTQLHKVDIDKKLW